MHWRGKAGVLPTACRALRAHDSVILLVTLRNDTDVVAPGARREFDTVNLSNGASVSNRQEKVPNCLPSIWTN